MTATWWGIVLIGLVAAAVIAASGYLGLAAVTWWRFGARPKTDGRGHDHLLDRFIPAFDVVERHHIRVGAPAPVTFAAARAQDLLRVPLVRLIIRARELAMGAHPDGAEQPHGLLAATLAMGWGQLAEIPDHEVVVGAVTQPWEPNVTFRAVPPSRFDAFVEPGFVKIVWTLRADPTPDGGSVFRTETRAVATDAAARARFRRYWAFASPGIALIRWLSLLPLKRDAERRADLARAGAGAHA
ncbi:MAG: hypothetical protein R2745_23280 [Vicinamibacterales bacterium]